MKQKLAKIRYLISRLLGSSNRRHKNTEPDITAPGVEIYETIKKNNHGNKILSLHK